MNVAIGTLMSIDNVAQSRRLDKPATDYRGSIRRIQGACLINFNGLEDDVTLIVSS